MRANRNEGPKKSAPQGHAAENSDCPAAVFPGHLLTIFVLLWLVTLGNVAALVPQLGLRDALPRAVATIEPNLAPWYELTVLPRIGEGLAEKIIRYRATEVRAGPNGDTRPAFTCPADMTRIKGIGPKTIRRMGPFLRFDER